jgi:hypothetical protein
MIMSRKFVGVGTLSLLLSVIGIAWSFSFHGFCLGDIVLNSIGVKAWSHGDSGTHYAAWAVGTKEELIVPA